MEQGYLTHFDLSQFVNDPNKDVPAELLAILDVLETVEACQSDLFDSPVDLFAVHEMYQHYVLTKKLDSGFKGHREVAEFLRVVLRQFDIPLISYEHMRAIDMTNGYIKMGGLQAMDAGIQRLKNIFSPDFPGRALLGEVLMFFAGYVERGCSKEGYIGVAQKIAPFIASKFTDCGWINKCDEFSREMTVASLLRIGRENIRFIFDIPVGPRFTSDDNVIIIIKDDQPSQRGFRFRQPDMPIFPFHTSSYRVRGDAVDPIPKKPHEKGKDSVKTIKSQT